jgi:hypothetical protein
MVISYNRNKVTEQYMVHRNTVEQQFIIHEKPATGSGDFIIEGAIASKGIFAETQHGWEWRDPTGVVTLGQVKVLDASGNTLPATMTVKADSTRISIAEQAMTNAAYPVTVDPEIGSNDFRISRMGAFDGFTTYLGQTSVQPVAVWLLG